MELTANPAGIGEVSGVPQESLQVVAGSQIAFSSMVLQMRPGSYISGPLLGPALRLNFFLGMLISSLFFAEETPSMMMLMHDRDLLGLLLHALAFYDETDNPVEGQEGIRGASLRAASYLLNPVCR
jgi:hypothetical protein